MANYISKPKEPEWRKKIQAGQIANRLMRFVNGEITMTPAQVTAALGLMKKVAPDLSAAHIENTHEGNFTLTWEE